MRSDYIATDAIGALLWALTPADSLICQIVLQTGWRIDDVLEIKTEQAVNALKLKKTALTICEKKTGKRSRKYIPRDLLQKCANQGGAIYLFEGRDSIEKHRTRQAVFMDLKRTAKKFGLKINLSPHSLRKNYAVFIYENYGFERVKKELNHTNDFVTMIYAFANQLQKKSGKP